MANAIKSIQHPATDSWSDDLYLLIREGHHPQSYDDPTLRLVFSLLWAVSALGLFLCLRALDRFPFTGAFLRIFAGVIALIGFPLALWLVVLRSELHTFGFTRALTYACYYHSPHWLAPELATILVCAFLYAFRKWPTQALWGLLPLTLHFALLAWLALRGAGSGRIILWPGYDLTWPTREYPQLIYPCFGFLASLAWGLYVRQPAYAEGRANSFRPNL